MNMFARFDEIPTMILQDTMETKVTYGQRGNRIPLTEFAGINMCLLNINPFKTNGIFQNV